MLKVIKNLNLGIYDFSKFILLFDKIYVTPIQPNIFMKDYSLFLSLDGGGECVDEDDCNNNGICKPESNDKGVCCCVVGFAGTNCDGK